MKDELRLKAVDSRADSKAKSIESHTNNTPPIYVGVSFPVHETMQIWAGREFAALGRAGKALLCHLKNPSDPFRVWEVTCFLAVVNVVIFLPTRLRRVEAYTFHQYNEQLVKEAIETIATRKIEDAVSSELFTTAVGKEEVERGFGTSAVVKA